MWLLPFLEQFSPMSTPVRCMGIIHIHGDRLVIHPSGGVGGVEALLLLLLLLSSLLLIIVPIVSCIVVASVVLHEERSIQCIVSSK